MEHVIFFFFQFSLLTWFENNTPWISTKWMILGWVFCVCVSVCVCNINVSFEENHRYPNQPEKKKMNMKMIVWVI